MEEQSVVRFYTQARKIPYLLGKIGDFKLPGGPYTLTQGVVAFIVAWIGKATMPMWAGGMITIVAWIPVLLIALACGYIAGRIPFKGRNPLMLLWGLVGYATAPSWGTQAGRPVRMGPSRRIRTTEVNHAASGIDPRGSSDVDPAGNLLGALAAHGHVLWDAPTQREERGPQCASGACSRAHR